MKLLNFEWKKMLQTKAVPVFLVLTVAFISILFGRNLLQQDTIQAEKIDHFSKLARDVYRQVVVFNDEVDRVGTSPELEAKIEAGRNLYAELRLLLEKIEEQDWKGELETEINVYQYAFEFLAHEDTRFNLTEQMMDRELRLNEALIQLDLPKQHMDLSIQTSIFMKKIVSTILSPIGFVVLLLVLTSVVTREFEDKNIQLVYTLPISRLKYLFVKFLSLLTTGLIWLLLVFGVSYLIAQLFGKNEGEIFDYPIYNVNDSFISSGDYLIHSIIYSISFIAFASALLLLIGAYIRNTILTIIIVFALFIGGFFVTNYGFDWLFNPFAYQAIDRAILTTPDFYPLGVGVLMIVTVILVFITLIVNRKRGI